MRFIDLMLQPSPLAPALAPAPAPSVVGHMSLALRDSVARVLSVLISILPGVLAFILAVAIMAAIGMLLSWVLRKSLTAARFDERFARQQSGSIADWSPSHSPTALAGRVAFWSCILLGLIVGVLTLDASYATGNSTITQSLLPYLTHSVGAILILFAGNILARYLARTVLIGAVNNQIQHARFLSIGVRWLVLVLTAAMALEHQQIGGHIVALAFGILFGGIVLTLALAVGLGSRDLVSRSLDRGTLPLERPRPQAAPPIAKPVETLRHF